MSYFLSDQISFNQFRTGILEQQAGILRAADTQSYSRSTKYFVLFFLKASLIDGIKLNYVLESKSLLGVKKGSDVKRSSST